MSKLENIKLKDISNFKYGKTIIKKDILEFGKYPVFSGYQIVGYLDEYQFADEQLIIVCRGIGGTGDIKISPKYCSITNLAIIFETKNTIYYRYLYWVLKNADTYSLRTGSAQPQITISSLENFEISIVTNIEKQKKIADFLDCFDQKIQLNTQINQTLEQIAQAIFKSWFIDFDPVKAKAEAKEQGTTDEQANIAAMSAISGKSADQLNAYKQTNPTDYQQLYQLAQAFPSEFEEIDGVEVPKGWGVEKIGNIANLVKGKKPKTILNNKENNSLPHILISSLSGKYSEFVEVSRNVVISEVKETIMVMDGASAGKCYIGHNGVIGSTLSKINLKNKLYWAIVYYFLKDKENDICANTTGTSIPHTDKTRVTNYQLIIPSDFILRKFNEISENTLVKNLINLSEILSLENTRDLLLPKLLSGEMEL